MTAAPGDCLFCKIVAREAPTRTIRETDGILAFHDIRPQAPVHALIIPKRHHASVGELAEADPALMAEVMREAHRAAVDLGIAGTGYRLVFNTGDHARQSVFHVHCHLIGGRSMTWPPG
jgi:histidine triad (HIT) family protein